VRVLLLSSILTACAAPVVARGPCSDASTAYDEKSVPLAVSVEGLKYPIRGPILSLRPPDKGQIKVEVAGGGYADARLVSFTMPSGEPFPFTVGDVLEVRVHQTAVSEFAADRAVEVYEPGGRLLTMEFEGAAAPEGWSASERSSGDDCLVVVRHQDMCAFVPSRSWRRFETPDGIWAVYAKCAGAPQVGGRARPEHAPGPVVVKVSRLPR
jgi:hypothetical protein